MLVNSAYSVKGAQPRLVSKDARHVSGEQRCRGRAERNQESPGEVGVHHEAGGQPIRTIDWAQGAGRKWRDSQAGLVCFSVSAVSDRQLEYKKKKSPIVHALSYRLRKGHQGLTQIQWLTLNCAGRLTLFILSVRPPWCEARSHIKMFFWFFCADDRAKEAEAENRSSWSPASHERQPPATRLRSFCTVLWLFFPFLIKKYQNVPLSGVHLGWGSTTIVWLHQGTLSYKYSANVKRRFPEYVTHCLRSVYNVCVVSIKCLRTWEAKHVWFRRWKHWF